MTAADAVHQHGVVDGVCGSQVQLGGLEGLILSERGQKAFVDSTRAYEAEYTLQGNCELLMEALIMADNVHVKRRAPFEV